MDAVSGERKVGVVVAARRVCGVHTCAQGGPVSWLLFGCPPAASGFRRALDHPQGFNLLWPPGSGHSGAAVFQADLLALSLQTHIQE